MTLLRSALFNAYFWLVTGVMALGSLPIRWFARERALGYGRLWARVVLAGLGPLAGAKVVVSGREWLPKTGPALIASQHQSAFDTLIWLLLMPRPAYVVKRELGRVPFYGPMLRPAGQILVDRRGGSRALNHLVHEGERARREGRQIIIFPEGTRVAPGEHGIVQPGVVALAVHTGLPVIPVATDSGRVWGRRAFCKRAGTIHIVVGRPLAAGESRRLLQRELALFYQNALARGLGGAVDNPVGRVPPRFAAGRNESVHSSE